MIVVTGATGNVGRVLVGALAAAGEKVTAVSRHVTGDAVPDGVRTVPADVTEPEQLRAAFEGARALFLHDGGGAAEAWRPGEILGLAAAAGVRKVVLLSSLGVVTRPESRSHGELMKSAEDAVRASGLDWTILRPGAFASNAYQWAEPVRTARTVVAPFGDIGLPVVHPADIAEVAALALRADGHTGQAYGLTGPAPITPREQVAAIAAALGEPVRFVDQDPGEARAAMLSFLPDWAVDTTLSVLGAPTAAELRISPVVRDLLGRAPLSFADWAQQNAAAFR